jgi:hypothetical protein
MILALQLIIIAALAAVLILGRRHGLFDGTPYIRVTKCQHSISISLWNHFVNPGSVRWGVSFTFRNRSSRFSHEWYNSPQARWLNLSVASPEHHRWWATSMTIWLGPNRPTP